jgi:hypothetical protein
MSFATTWVPNIVCTVGGCLLSFAIGWRAATRAARLADKHTLMLENVLVGLANQGVIELARDNNGRITGGRNITVKVGGVEAKLTAGQLTPTVGQDSPVSNDQ